LSVTGKADHKGFWAKGESLERRVRRSTRLN